MTIFTASAAIFWFGYTIEFQLQINVIEVQKSRKNMIFKQHTT